MLAINYLTLKTTWNKLETDLKIVQRECIGRRRKIGYNTIGN